jgi:hypothetical protein
LGIPLQPEASYACLEIPVPDQRQTGISNQTNHDQSNMKKFLLIAAVLTGASVASNAQDIISWAYDNGNAIPATGTAGVLAATNWNLTGAAGSLSLSDNNGTASGTTLSLAGGFGDWGIGGVSGPDADGTYNKSVFDGYYNSLGSTLTLGNIPFSIYNVFVYFSSDADGRTGTISDGTSTFSFSTIMRNQVDNDPSVTFIQTTDTGTLYPGANYALFSGLTGGSQTFTIANTSDGMGFAGIQIQAVPEPGVMALVGLGSLGFLLMSRRQRKV